MKWLLILRSKDILINGSLLDRDFAKKLNLEI